MNRFKLILFILAIVCFGSGTVIAQQHTITGIVTSTDGESLPGVNIQVKGSVTGTVTNADGAYSISAGSGEILVFSFIGMVPQEVLVADQQVIDVIMQNSTTDLEELVIIGYGYTTKKDLTGSVGTVSGKQITDVPIVRTEEALRGRISGVQVFQNSGKPGDAPTVLIRGRNTINAGSGPLWIVDGFPFAGSINPNDIESMTVLKDASATAIYGSRGSNGVILITTRKGKTDKQSISLTANYGVTDLRHKIELLNAHQWNHIGVADTVVVESPDTDWQDLVYRKGSQQDYNLNFSNGSEKSSTFASVNYKDVDGIVKGTGYQSLKVRVNYEMALTKNFKITNNLYGSMSRSDEKTGVVSEALLFPPIYPVKTDSGWTYISSVGEGNPVGNIEDRDNLWRYYKVYDQLTGQLTLFKNLTIKSSLSGAVDNRHNQNFTNRSISWAYSEQGFAQQQYSVTSNWANENQATFKKVFNNHSVAATAFFTQEFSRDEAFNASNRLLLTQELKYNNLNLNDTMARVGSSASQDALMSFGGRFDYDYNSRYYATITFRRESSSKFAENHKWANFPAMALAWRINEEAFLKDVAVISNMKLRLSYGITGTQAIGRGYTRERYNLSSTYAIFNNEPQQALNLTRRTNPDLTWETTHQYDGGLDISLFNSRLALTTDYYYKITKDLLFLESIPAAYGGGQRYINKGTIRNKGLELSLDASIVENKGLNWKTNANISFNRNKVLDLKDTKVYPLGQIAGGWINDETHFMMEGYPLGIFRGYIVEGIFTGQDEVKAHPDQKGMGIEGKPGEYKIKDINNDGVIDQKDATIIGNPEPDFIFGLTNELSYKNLSLNIFLQGSVGNEVYNILNVAHKGGLKRYNRSAAYLDYWSPENTEASIPAPGAITTKSVSAYVEDGSYVKLRDISLTYSVPKKYLERLNVSNLGLSISAQNYLTFSRYEGYDPEVSTWGSSSTYQGIDWGTYPASKSITFGVKVDF
ncbi:MAG: TonB-dependent receptor [Bacteroidales bacterium]|nr:TonB-dependent receptor [Bacteroidales bacterium]